MLLLDSSSILSVQMNKSREAAPLTTDQSLELEIEYKTEGDSGSSS